MPRIPIAILPPGGSGGPQGGAEGSLFESLMESVIEPAEPGRRNWMEGHRLVLSLSTLQRGTALALAAVRAVNGDETLVSFRRIVTYTALAITRLLCF